MWINPLSRDAMFVRKVLEAPSVGIITITLPNECYFSNWSSQWHRELFESERKIIGCAVYSGTNVARKIYDSPSPTAGTTTSE